MSHFHMQITTVYKVQAHANIDGNEQDNKLTIMGWKQAQKNVRAPYEHAHSTPYCFKKDWWHSIHKMLDKGPNKHLE